MRSRRSSARLIRRGIDEHPDLDRPLHPDQLTVSPIEVQCYRTDHPFQRVRRVAVVEVHHCAVSGRAVEGHTAADVKVGVAVDVDAVEDNVVWYLLDRVLCTTAVAKPDYSIVGCHIRLHSELHAHDAIVVSAGCGLEGGRTTRGYDLGH